MPTAHPSKFTRCSPCLCMKSSTLLFFQYKQFRGHSMAMYGEVFRSKFTISTKAPHKLLNNFRCASIFRAADSMYWLMYVHVVPPVHGMLAQIRTGKFLPDANTLSLSITRVACLQRSISCVHLKARHPPAFLRVVSLSFDSLLQHSSRRTLLASDGLS